MGNTYRITEYGSFVAEKKIEGFVSLPQHTFDALEAFILTNRSNDSDALELLTLSAKKNIGKVITAKNYVGVISMTDGTTIEILPKLYSTEAFTEAAVKKLLINMLRSLKESPYKTFQTSNVSIDNMNIFEVFIRMFVNEVLYIEKRGLRYGYQTVQRNESVFKGKLIVSEHIKRNFAHKERAVVEYDEFNKNRPENRLIKSTLQYLNRCSKNTKNRADIKNLLNSFSEVDDSSNISEDFSKCVSDRNMTDYTVALMWCKVFLLGKTFTTFAGSEIAVALLFPMNTLFESYVAQKLRKVLDAKDYYVMTQDKRFHLFDNPRQFLIKPDIVVKSKNDGSLFILDTKWKLLSASKTNYGISQADMYQMYSYQKKYGAKTIYLLYPTTDSLGCDKYFSFKSNDNVTVTVRFIDLLDLKTSLESLKDDILNQ